MINDHEKNYEEYHQYLSTHRTNVRRSMEWLEKNLPEIVSPMGKDRVFDIKFHHDMSKLYDDEYYPYERHWYSENLEGDERRIDQNAYDIAVLKHIHRNPHHWQYWVFPAGNGKDEKIFPMDYNYVVEMICDWWSFSWASGNLMDIFTWWVDYQNKARFADETRSLIGEILEAMYNKLSSN